MIKNILGAVVGANLAKNSRVDSGTGAILGSVAPAVIARMSLPVMVAIGVGGYLFKRHRDQQQVTAASDNTSAPATPALPAA